MEKQCSLFPEKEEHVILKTRLEAESVLGAWYELSLISTKIGFLIKKSSGAARRSSKQNEIWFRPDLMGARRKYSNILAAKINPNRKNPRKYHVVSKDIDFFNILGL